MNKVASMPETGWDKKKIGTVLFTLFIAGSIIAGYVLIGRVQDVREQAAGPSCPVDGAYCEWDSITGAKGYRVIVREYDGGTWREVAHTRAGPLKAVFTAEKDKKYSCTVVVEYDDAHISCPEKIGTIENTCKGIESPSITPSPAPSATPSPYPTVSISPSATPKPTSTPVPTNTPKPTNTPAPTNTPVPTNTPKPTNTPAPTNTPVPTNTPKPSNTPAPTNTPVPTNTPKPNAPSQVIVQNPTNTPRPSLPATGNINIHSYFILGVGLAIVLIVVGVVL